MSEILLAFVDYENLRMAFRNYVEFITVRDIIRAFESLGRELGDLRTIFFYGDWTRRSEDARLIEEHGHRAVNVLSTRHGKDRSDQAMALDMYDAARDNPEVTALLLGSGDADFKEVILRSRERGKRVYVLCFGVSASRELLTLTHGVYPLEARLGLTERSSLQPAMPGFSRTEREERLAALVRLLDSLERSLPYVVKNYLREKILLPSGGFGETLQDVERLIREALQQGIIETGEMQNPRRVGRTVAIVKLARNNPFVSTILGGKYEEAGQ